MRRTRARARACAPPAGGAVPSAGERMSMQARKRRRKHNRAGPTRMLLFGAGVLAATCVIGAIVAVGYVLHVAQAAPKLSSLHPLIGDGASELFAADGTSLGFIRAGDVRSPVTWDQIPTDLKNASVAIEDQRFYHNDGVDLTAIFRSAVKDLLDGEALQGGSTITMQLVRNLYLGSDQHTLKQKIIEAKLAIEYNETHSKRSILTSYLNSVPYTTVDGQTALGVQAAARIIFDEPVSRLNLAQTALLAGLPQAPSEYNPFLHPAAARERRNIVLAKMAELHYISAAQANAAQAAPLQVKLGNFYSQRREDFFFEYVREQLEQRYGRQTVEQGGLKVYTTLDLNMQGLARKAIGEVLDEPGDPASAVVTLDPHNGYIEAMAESESYEQSQYNLAADGHRQPGSTFKAIDLADALTRGVNPNSTYYFSHTLEPGWLSAYPTYEVKTFEGVSENRSMNLVTATLKSDNTVYAQLAADLGEQSVTQTAYAMGVKTHLSSYPAEALGGLTLGVTPLEMAVVYATLADGGWRNTPIAITKVVFPDGRVDSSWGTPSRVKVLGEGVTAEETSILEQNVESGTATRSAISCPTAAKTGTTSELVDAWLDGYTPEYSTVVWMGYPNKRISMTDVHGEPQQGGYLPAEIWHDYMAAVTEGQACVPFPPSKEPISYRPFFGHFALTGRGQLKEGQLGNPYPVTPYIAPPVGPLPKAPRGANRGPGTGGRAGPGPEVTVTPETKSAPEPSTPEAGTPGSQSGPETPSTPEAAQTPEAAHAPQVPGAGGEPQG
jgi:penicillin-binding protein 1A